MKRRYRDLPPPDDAEHIGGEGFEFKPEHDRVNAGMPLPPSLELTPVGPAPTIYEFRSEHDQVRSTNNVSPEQRRAAFVAELERCNAVEGVTTGKVDHILHIHLWKDVVPDPSVWERLTEFLLRVGLVYYCTKFLAIGRGPLASYWLTVDGESSNGWTFKSRVLEWLDENWREEWNRISDKAKRELMERFARQADRSEGARSLISEITRALRWKE
jgi:hypothetical protein